MSDYISKSALIESWCERNCGERRCRDNWDKCMFVLHAQNQPTLDETEIIRKAFDRVVAKLESEKERYDKDCTYWDEHAWKDEIQFNEYDMSRKKSECFEEAIDVVKKEGGIE